MPSFSPIAGIYLVGMISASLTFIVLWFRTFRETRRFFRIGITEAIVRGWPDIRT